MSGFPKDIPAGNGVPRPFLSDIPAGNGMGIVQSFKSKPGLIPLDTDQFNYHAPGSEWTITEKVTIAEWGGDLDYEKHLSPGDLVFISPSDPRPLAEIRQEE